MDTYAILSAEDVRREAMLLVSDGREFWGPHPQSNRWGELEVEHLNGGAAVPGEAVLFACRQGWLTVQQSERAGYVMPNDTDGGTMDCHWLFTPVPAWSTILRSRLERGDFRPVGVAA